MKIYARLQDLRKLGRPSVGYPTLVALLSLLVRSVPVILGWPYPVGFDTTAYYLPLMVRGIPDLGWVFHQFSLHQLLLSLTYSLYPNAFYILNIYAIVLLVALSLSVYWYCKSVQKLDPQTSFLASTMFTFSLVTLRLSWDQYRMMLGLLFSIMALTALASHSPRRRFLSVGLVGLVVVSNALPAVLLMLSLGLNVAKNHRKLHALSAEITSLLVICALLVSQELIVGPNFSLGTNFPFSAIPLSLGLSESMYGLLFLLVTSWPVLILLPFQAMKRLGSGLHMPFFYWALFFAIVPTAVGIYAVSPVMVLWMTSFPLAIMFGKSLQEGSHKLVKGIAIAMLVCTVVSGLGYAVSSPASPPPYILLSSRFAQYFPTGYLQSTVPISQEGGLIAVLGQAIPTLPTNATLVVAQQFYGIALLSPNPNHIRIVNAGQIGEVENTVAPIPVSININSITSLESMHNCFTIWWTQPNDWYGVSKLPSDFQLGIGNEDFSLYYIK